MTRITDEERGRNGVYFFDCWETEILEGRGLDRMTDCIIVHLQASSLVFVILKFYPRGIEGDHFSN